MVKKKISDIMSHKESSMSKFAPLRKTAAKRTAAGFLNKKNIMIFSWLLLFAALALSYFLIPPKADIEITPQKEIKEGSVDWKATVETVEVEKTITESFFAQGTKLKAVKAQGTIRVYNNYSAVSQPLIANTRFVSDDGKLFRTLARVVVPGNGFVDITVVADQAGEEYNIKPSTFSIPGFAGTPKYTAFYAKSSELMSGGLKTEVTVVTDDDLDRAKSQLAEKAVLESKKALNDKYLALGYIVIDEAISTKAVDFTASAKAGDEVKDFSAQIKATAKALVFKESSLKGFAAEYIKGKLLPEENLIESSLNIAYALKAVNPDKGELNLKLAVSAETHSLPPVNQIKEQLKNKSMEEVKSYIKSLPQVEKSKIKFWPFWARLSPADQERIKITLLLD